MLSNVPVFSVAFRFPTVEVFATIRPPLVAPIIVFRFPTVEVFATIEILFCIPAPPFRFPTVEVFATIARRLG